MSWDQAAIGSDVARSRLQALARRLADLFVRLFRLDSGGYLTTEIVQRIAPVHRIPTSCGEILCRGGHGRLRWRARTFHREEPETVRWLDTIGPDDVFWDVGANVGLYAVYAAVRCGCRVVAFEPEAANHALLIENVHMNRVGHLVDVSSVALGDRSGFGVLDVHDLTRGGAYNRFREPGASIAGALRQVVYGARADDLVGLHGFPRPTHLKIDVDGNEPEIVSGARQLLADGRLRSLLVEVDRGDPRHSGMTHALLAAGFVEVSRRSNWESRRHRQREAEQPTVNVIFEHAGVKRE